MNLVHVCLFDLHRHTVSRDDLPAAELARADRFMREEDRQRYLLARTLIRRLCASHLGCAPIEADLRQAEHGKPYLHQSAEPSARLEFNTAHSGTAVALAWSIGHPVGVDVENRDRSHSVSFHDLARTAFSPEEQAVIGTSPPHEIAERFFRIWVRKEAIVKAEGCGIGAGATLKHFSVARGEGPDVIWPESVHFPKSAREWQITWIPAPDRYEAAVAMPFGCRLHVQTPERAFPR